MNRSKTKLYRVPILGFILIILIGAIILKLPICNNKPISSLNSLFISTSGVCITGYTPVVLAEQFNFIGQLVLLFLVEIGALGFMTVIIFIASIVQKRMNFSDVMLLEDGELNANFKQKVKNIIKYTFIIQGFGAALLSLRFIPIYGAKTGFWYSIFHAVTAFCNSGFDILGANSFEAFTNDIYVNAIIMVLIILGGIGFLVLDDLVKAFKKKSLKGLRLQSKIVLVTTGALLVFSVIYIKLMEPQLTLLQSMFTAVTLRTAGFSTINMANSSQATKMMGIILMFIGGAPGSTSGGIRIIVFAVLMLSIIASLKNKKQVVVFYRRIPEHTIIKAITITGWSILAVLVGVIIMSFANNFGLENIIFHCVGAFSDTGLGTVPTSYLNVVGKWVIMFLMFIGRLGPIVAFRVLFSADKELEHVKYVDGDLML